MTAATPPVTATVSRPSSAYGPGSSLSISGIVTTTPAPTIIEIFTADACKRPRCRGNDDVAMSRFARHAENAPRRRQRLGRQRAEQLLRSLDLLGRQDL